MSGKNELKHQVVVIGAGPGGTTLAALLAKKGLDVALIEKEEFPRFRIGESLLPFSMDVLRKSGVFSQIDSGQHIKKYGAQFVEAGDQQQEIYFEFASGLDSDHPFAFEVKRDVFDQELLDHAIEVGVTLYQQEKVLKVHEFEDRVLIETDKNRIECSYIGDASGSASVVGRNFSNRVSNMEFNNVAIFSHFDGVKRSSGQREGDIIIGALPNRRWSWMIPFKDGGTSVGIVLDARSVTRDDYTEEFLRETLDTHDLLKERMSTAVRTREVQTAANYSAFCKELIGPRWILLGDAASFIDPVFSTGVHVSLKSAEFAADVLLAAKDNESLIMTELGQGYQQKVETGVNRLKSLVRIFYKDDFIKNMRKVLNRKVVLQSFTSAIAGDVWNEDNILYQRGIL